MLIASSCAHVMWSLPTEPPLKLNLLICLYNETDERRVNEYIYCLEKNLKNPSIKKIHVSYDTSRDPKKRGTIHQWLQEHDIAISYIKNRQTVGHCFRLANRLFPDEYVILSNADIWFDETLALLEERHMQGKFFACSKYNEQRGAPTARKKGPLPSPYPKWTWSYSQDSWIFKTPFVVHPILNQVYIGQISTEGPIVYAAERMGLRVYDPRGTIHCIHEHRSHVRKRPSRSRYWGIVEFPRCTLEEITEQKGAATFKPIYRLRIPKSFATGVPRKKGTVS